MAITVETGLLSLFQALAEVGEKLGQQALPPPSRPGRAQAASSASPEPEAVAAEKPAEPNTSGAQSVPDTGAPSPVESVLLARVDALQAENGRMIAQMAEQQQMLSQLIALQVQPKAKLGVVS